MGKLFNPLNFAQNKAEGIGRNIGESLYDRRNPENHTEDLLDQLEDGYFTLAERSDVGSLSKHFDNVVRAEGLVGAAAGIAVARAERKLDETAVAASVGGYLAAKSIISGVDGYRDRAEIHMRSIEAIAGRPRTEFEVLENNPDAYFNPPPEGEINGTIPGYEAGEMTVNGTTYTVVFDATKVLDGDERVACMVIGPDGHRADDAFWEAMEELPADIQQEKYGELIGWSHDAAYELDQFKNEDGTYDVEAYQAYIDEILNDPDKMAEIAKEANSTDQQYQAAREAQPTPEQAPDAGMAATNDTSGPAVPSV